MKAVVQRVARAEVRVDGERVGAIGRGMLVLLGVLRGDGERDADRLAERVAGMRIFPPAEPCGGGAADRGGTERDASGTDLGTDRGTDRGGDRGAGRSERSMERSALDLAATEEPAAVLVVSQFTLAADTRRGRRASYVAAAEPAVAEALYERFARRLEELGLAVARGRFRARMEVELVNDGPVTFLLDEPREGPPGGPTPRPSS